MSDECTPYASESIYLQACYGADVCPHVVAASIPKEDWVPQRGQRGKKTLYAVGDGPDKYRGERPRPAANVAPNCIHPTLMLASKRTLPYPRHLLLPPPGLLATCLEVVRRRLLHAGHPPP